MSDPAEVTPPGGLFELDDETRRHRQAELEQARQDRHRDAVAAWRRVPHTYQARELELLPRCSPLLRQKLGRAALPTLSALILGPSGIGKTTGLAWLVRRALAEFESSNGERAKEAPGLLWTTAAEIALSDRRHPLGADRAPLLAQAILAPLLVCDDVGLEPPGVVAEVLWARYDAGRPVLATSGCTKKQLTAHLGAAGVRRLTDQHAGSPVLVVDAHDRDDTKGQGGGKG
jgi:DNA polymerase III delta prime subunit